MKNVFKIGGGGGGGEMSRAAVTIKRDLRSRMIFLTCIRILLLGPSLSHGDGACSRPL